MCNLNLNTFTKIKKEYNNAQQRKNTLKNLQCNQVTLQSQSLWQSIAQL